MSVKAMGGRLTLVPTIACNQTWEAIAVAENRESVNAMKSIMETETEPCWYYTDV